MNPIKLKIQIETFDTPRITCTISDNAEKNQLNYHISDETISLNQENHLATLIRNNKHQFKKIIHSAIKGNIKVGQIINCVFIENFKFLIEDDFNRFIQVDRRQKHLNITVSDFPTSNIHKIYADGSFASKTQQSGYGGFTESPDGEQDIYFRSFENGASNLMELLAITEGLQRLHSINKLQVNTDSRFVIRGLSQWCHFWKHNNWQTAYGRDVKYTKHWKQAYQLCENKFVEFKWIKGHSGDIKQDFCHQLAKESSSRK